VAVYAAHEASRGALERSGSRRAA